MSSPGTTTGTQPACLIFNPAAKGGKARIFRTHLDEFASFCELRSTGGPGDASRLAARAVAEGFGTVIAAGGDGTIHEVLNGIAGTSGGLEQVRLGVLPLGTINVFACELGIPARWADAMVVLRRGHEKRIDLPVAELQIGGKTERRYFIQLGGAGLDARAVELVEWKLKTKVGPLAYIHAGLKALNEKHAPISVKCGSAEVAGETVFLGNGKFYGGKLAFFPTADMSDGVVDACIFPRLSILELMRIGLGLAVRQPHAFSSAVHLRGTEISLSSDKRVCVELDGELVGVLPARITVLPKALRVIVP